MLITLCLLASCGTGVADESAAPSVTGPILTVTDGTVEKVYTEEDLRALPTMEATFEDVTYRGVSLKVLLEDAGIDPFQIRVVKAAASDGFSANYESDLFLLDDTMVAFARADGPLSDEERPFRMVLPDQAGSFNVRFLIKIQAIP
jgi:hypothetical protein